MNAKIPMVKVTEVEKFMAVVVENCGAVESKIIVLKTRLAKRTISNDSVMRELDEILTLIRK